MTEEIIGLRFFIKGIVQGVGFRPFIYSLALRHHLTGWVKNTSSGVELEINGSPTAAAAFKRALQQEKPPLARLDSVAVESIPPNHYLSFEILHSTATSGEFIPISPDIGICPACQAELFDPLNRRYRYPFINCTHCGPRFTIITDIPYDRPNTTMGVFPMCPDCQREYDNPLDRRFHAQPTACPVCGPQVELVFSSGKRIHQDTAIRLARQMLKQGKILAIKGLGGYHLACDACNTEAVSALRERKKRSDKPFALMAFDLQTIEQHANLSQVEREMLLSRQKPIVLARRNTGSPIASEVAPQLDTLGMMLAYTPLHLLLLEPEEGFASVLVMTSGNLSDEPIAYQDQDAFNRLGEIADAFLIHNREIHTRVDDSVVNATGTRLHFLRRSRGYAPDSIRLPTHVPPILAVGAELKNTFCLTRENYAFLSHHIGDMENLETFQSFEEGIRHFENLFHVQPEVLACDLHPNYLATCYAQERSAQNKLPLVTVQHHHAHLAACLADNGWITSEPVIGLIYDGTGLGTDEAIWGGEVLVGGAKDFERVFHLKYTPLPGGDASIHKPARMALAHLWQANLPWVEDLPPVIALGGEEKRLLRAQLEHRLNTPFTSSMGRLFDAAASLIGIRHQATYEAQAAIEMEAIADPNEEGFYPIAFDNDQIDPAPIWYGLITDLRDGIAQPALSARFHNTIAQINLAVCRKVRIERGITAVALSGGVWQNRVLFQKSITLLEQDRFTVLTHQQAPANDGGLALGQAWIAANSLSN